MDFPETWMEGWILDQNIKLWVWIWVKGPGFFFYGAFSLLSQGIMQIWGLLTWLVSMSEYKRELWDLDGCITRQGTVMRPLYDVCSGSLGPACWGRGAKMDRNCANTSDRCSSDWDVGNWHTGRTAIGKCHRHLQQHFSGWCMSSYKMTNVIHVTFQWFECLIGGRVSQEER